MPDMVTEVRWDDEPIATLFQPAEGGAVLVPPVVLDKDEHILMGAEILEAVAQSGVTARLLVIRNADPGFLTSIIHP